VFESLLRRRAFRTDDRCAPPLPTHVRRLDRSDDPLSGELTLIGRLSVGDCILCVAGEMVPCDGTVVDGAALVGAGWSDCRTQARGRAEVGSRLFGGTVVLSNYVIVRVVAAAPRSA
jgi:high-affinity K+ transport system ATPase subunit B